MKIAYQGVSGSYSESCAKKMYPDSETIACKTFDECFERASENSEIRAIIPESNKTTGNIGVEYLIFKYRLNIYAEHFFPINHNLLGVKGSKLQDIKSANKVKKKLSKRYEKRSGGYTRIIKAGFRYGDNAPMAIIEFVDRDVEAKRIDKKKKSPSEKADKKEEIKVTTA